MPIAAKCSKNSATSSTACVSAAKACNSKRACALVASARYGRYLKQTGSRLAIDARAVAAAERLEGKFVVHSNDDTLTPAGLALGYKQLQRVEQAWRDMKSGLKLRPVFHWAVHRIHAHVAITVLALLLERVAEHARADTWRNIRDDLERILLAQLLSPHGTVWQVTEPTPEAAKRLTSLGISPPPPVLRLAGVLDTRAFRASARKRMSRAPFAPVCHYKVSNPGQTLWKRIRRPLGVASVARMSKRFP